MESLPSEVVEQICEQMDPASLSKFGQSNWEKYNICLTVMKRKLAEKLKDDNFAFESDLYSKFGGDLEDMMTSVNIDTYLPLDDIKAYLNKIKNNKDKIREFVLMLNSLVDSELYYGAVIESIAYEISPDLYSYIDSIIDELRDNEELNTLPE